jgi:multiple sugar transport system substrate-binding protein
MVKEAWAEGLIPEEVVTWDDSSNNKAYQSGLVTMIYNTGSVVKWMQENDPDLLAQTTLMVVPAGPKGTFVQGDVWGLALPSSTQHPEFTKGLAQYISQPERYEALIEEMGGLRLPVYKDLQNMEMWSDPALKPLADSIPDIYLPGYPGPVTDAALEAFQQLVVANMFTRVLTDDWTPDEAIAEAVTTLETILEETQ